MRVVAVLVASVALSASLAGCSGGCPSEAVLRTIFEDAGAFLDDPAAHAFEQQVVGTIAGDLEDATITVNGPEGQTRIQDSEGDFRIDAPYFSKQSAATNFYGRNHLPDLIADFWAGDEGSSFDDEIGFDDYSTSCVEYEGQDAVRFEWAPEDGIKRVLIAERGGDHRPLWGQVVDEAQQNNYRMAFEYDDIPEVSPDRNMPRWAATFYLDITENSRNSRGGTDISATLADGTEWVPLSELEVHLVNAQTGFVYFSDDLEDGGYDMADGDLFTYTDEDDNGLVSPGDSFAYTIGPGLDIAFWDEWADGYVSLA